MKRLVNLCVSLAFILALPACGGSPDLSASGQEQPAELPPTPLAGAGSSLDPQNPYYPIQSTLRAVPPCTGSPELRREAILALDSDLKDDSLNWRADMIDFYSSMIGYVEAEISEPVPAAARVWSMYNHGFIVKTPAATFAFDLVDGYEPWDVQIPDAILDQVQVLLITHSHADHRQMRIIRAVTAHGGSVVLPAEDNLSGEGLYFLPAGGELTLAGLQIRAFDGLHAEIPLRMFLVTTPDGLQVLHTGDNQTSETLPAGLTVDILLLNAWVNESGSASAVVGMQNSIRKIDPELTILGHIQELSHYYAPTDVKSRLSFEAPLALEQDQPPGSVSVQIWGEHCDFPLK